MGDLPFDVIQELVDELPLRDRRNLRLVNKRFNHLTEQAVWARQIIKLHIKEKEFSELGFQRLEELRNSFDSAGKIQLLDLEVSINDMEGVERLKKVGLPEILRTLQSLRSVEWKVSSNDAPWAQGVILNSLASLPELCKVSLHAYPMSEPLSPIDLGLFRSGKLEDLSIKANFADRERFMSSLTSVLLQNPNISHLNLDSDTHLTASSLRFKDIFPRSLTQPLRLKHLSILGPWVIEFPDTVAHLQSLSSLEILTRQGDVNPTFWEKLQSQNVHVRRLTASVNTKVLNYLSSYSGLEYLSVSSLGVLQPEETADDLAQILFRRVIPKHLSTLEDIRIFSSSARAWCLGDWNTHTLGDCTRLKFLRIGIHSEDLFETEDPDRHVLSILVQRVSMLPNLRLLFISPAIYLHGRGAALIDRIFKNMSIPLNELPQFEIVVKAPGGSRPVFYFPEMDKMGRVSFTTRPSVSSRRLGALV